jgi:hypothetical protein
MATSCASFLATQGVKNGSLVPSPTPRVILESRSKLGGGLRLQLLPGWIGVGA